MSAAGISPLEHGILEGENPVRDLLHSSVLMRSLRVGLLGIAALSGW